MEYGVLQKFQHVAAEIEGKKFGKGEGDGDMVFQGIKERPVTFPVYLFSV